MTICVKTATIFYSTPRGSHIHKRRRSFHWTLAENYPFGLVFSKGLIQWRLVAFILDSTFVFPPSHSRGVSYKVDCNSSHGLASFMGHATQRSWIRRVYLYIGVLGSAYRPRWHITALGGSRHDSLLISFRPFTSCSSRGGQA